jgi:hypothetical protein
MKLNKETLIQIIKEELEAVLDESAILKQFAKDKKEKLSQHIRNLSKDPDEVEDALGPFSFNMMGQTLIDDYPKLMSFPMSRNRRIQKASEEMEKLPTSNLNDFYNPDSSGTSVFSRVLKLLPELQQIPRVKRAIAQAGSDPLKVTARIGKRVTYSQIERKIRELIKNAKPLLQQYDDGEV